MTTETITFHRRGGGPASCARPRTDGTLSRFIAARTWLDR